MRRAARFSSPPGVELLLIEGQLATPASYALEGEPTDVFESPRPATRGSALPGTLTEALYAELVAFRRDLHMHPELGNQEFRTTAAIKARLRAAGLRPRVLASGTGLICDIGAVATARRRPGSALRADIDALPIPDTKSGAPTAPPCPAARTPAATTCTPPSCSAPAWCWRAAPAGPAAAAGTADLPARRGGLPGGAPTSIEAGALDGVGRIIAVHCDPRVDVGRIGLREGADHLRLRPAGGLPGRPRRPHRPPAPDHRPGHAPPPRSPPSVPAAARPPRRPARRARRRLGPHRGRATPPNVIPQHAELSGTVRCLDLDAWRAGAGPGHRGDRRGRHAAPGQVGDQLRARSPAGGQRPGRRPTCCATP